MSAPRNLEASRGERTVVTRRGVLVLLLLLAPATSGCLQEPGEPAVDEPSVSPASPSLGDPPSTPSEEQPEFLPPHDPPTEDPPEPYDFDPSLPVQLERNESGFLEQSCGYRQGEDGPERVCPEQHEPEKCSPHDAQYPTPASDADQDRIFDDFERHMDDALANESGGRVQALVGFTCPVTWDFILGLRETVGSFPVNSVWSTGFSADVTREQVERLAAHEDARAIEGNRLGSGAPELAAQR